MVIHIFTRVIDFVFPPSPSYERLRRTPLSHWQSCLRQYVIGETICLSNYADPSIKAAITAGKFEHNTNALALLGITLRTYLDQSETSLPPRTTVFVPIPLHHTRQRERGYNQVAEIVKAGTKNTSYRILPLLRRTRATSPQSHLKRAERLSHLDGVFTYANQTINWNSVTVVVLIDDVMTTGSTLTTAATVLRSHLPPHVTLVTMALAH